MNISIKNFRTSIYKTLIFSFFGLILICILVAGFSGLAYAATYYIPQILVGYAAMVLLIEYLGIKIRNRLLSYWVGPLFSILTFLVGIISGSFTSMIMYNDWDFFDFIVKPLYWIGLFGLLPCLIIGIFGTKSLRSGISSGEQDAAPNLRQR